MRLWNIWELPLPVISISHKVVQLKCVFFSFSWSLLNVVKDKFNRLFFLSSNTFASIRPFQIKPGLTFLEIPLFVQWSICSFLQKLMMEFFVLWIFSCFFFDAERTSWQQIINFSSFFAIHSSKKKVFWQQRKASKMTKVMTINWKN